MGTPDLGNWIAEEARSDEDIRARVAIAKAAFWQNKEIMRRNTRSRARPVIEPETGLVPVLKEPE